MSALPKPTALMSMGTLRLVETSEQTEPRRLPHAKTDAQLLSELRALRRENADLADKLQDSETRLRGTQKKLRGLQKTRDEATPSIDFADAEEWVRHHVHLGWLQNYSAIDRAAHPLGEYLVGAAFADSVRPLAPQLQAKVWRAAVDVVTRRGRHLHSREAHPLRSGTGARAPEVVRAEDDARCFRYSVGFKAAGARRLHAWHLQDGRIELCRVVTHGDMSP
ncbi:hypothetical protein [Pseudoclavibacter helvolus]|uniref:Uncharacterized protein n=1 Tax=Pseudoclavibacter helvolus TaxID=255205 RepID=A0A7W4UP95_9MICO|nr:hypothetical protein [Pseudoclavibacter helvolus]MBB2958043.1 hypothetical protein [Pseudoclavibacter helvolus]